MLCKIEIATGLFKVPLPQGKVVKRKGGRPTVDEGNPFSPDVTPKQRRVMLRRVANCQSARRVRDRRNENMNRVVQKVSRTGDMDDFYADAAVAAAILFMYVVASDLVLHFHITANPARLTPAQADYLKMENAFCAKSSTELRLLNHS